MRALVPVACAVVVLARAAHAADPPSTVTCRVREDARAEDAYRADAPETADAQETNT